MRDALSLSLFLKLTWLIGQVHERVGSPKASAREDASNMDAQPGQTDGSADASTSMSEGEFRDPLSLLAVESSFIPPGSPPASQGPHNQPPRIRQTVDASQTLFPLSFSGTTVPYQPSWREGGPTYETLAVPPRSGRPDAEIISVMGRAERRAARRAARRLRNGAQGAQSAASFMAAVNAADMTADSRTESELSDGELAGSVVWWIGTPAGDHSMMKGSGGESEASDGEISRPV